MSHDQNMADSAKQEAEEAENEQGSSSSSSSSSGSEYETDTDDSLEDEVEPKLKYERIGNDLTNILSRDAASCIAVHTKFLALGTHWGMIHILDLQGNNIRSKETPAHTTTVNQISIDDHGDNIASCSDDGRVVISGLYSTDNNQLVNFDRPIKAVAIDPDFYKPHQGSQFVTGDDKLVLNEKGFLSRQKTTVLHQGEGPIRSVKWKSHFVAWANDQGVKVFDMTSRQRITFIAKERTDLRADVYRCNLYWKDDRTLLIAWGDSIKVCKVKDRRTTPDARDLPSRYVEIVAMFTTDFMVCGLANYGPTSIALLCYDEKTVQYKNGKLTAPRPHLRVVEGGMDYSDELSNDALSIRGFTEYRCNDYHLEALPEENMFFIVSPKDVVVARQRDQDDHIQWQVEHQQFQEAMALAATYAKELKRYTYQDIGRQYLDHLIKEENHAEAARLCVTILGKNKTAWEEQAFRFAKIRQLQVLAPYLPRGDPKLSPGIYEMVLNEFLHSDQKGFQDLIRVWSSDLYNIQTVVNAVLDKIDRDRNNSMLMQCLADLYTQDKRYDKAMGIYLRLKDAAIFEIIHKHQLFEVVSDKLILLMDVDKQRAVKLCLEHMDKIPMEKVVKQLEKSPSLLHSYLDQLFKKDHHMGQDYHALQVNLYAEYDRSRLLTFLRNSSYYPLQAALQVCQQRSYNPEMVFLLGRMGNTKQALKLITTELKDVDQAIEFCKEHNDKELWEDLINFSMDKPSFITGLLHNIGTHVDPIILIRHIREGMEIPGLRDSLVKILQDYNLQRALREGCKKILVTDCYNLLERLVKTQRKGIRVDTNQYCQACHEVILDRDPRRLSDVAVFYCHHAFHEGCLPAHMSDSCMICTAQKRSPGNVTSLRR